MSRLAVSTAVSASATDDRLVARAVELDLGARGGLVAVERGNPSRTGTWNSRLTIPMWLRRVPLVQMIAGELVVDRREERRAGVAHQRRPRPPPRCP